MAHSAHQNKEDIKEFQETESEIQKKAHILADLIVKSKHCIMFTGAGVSTSAGIPDFRGPEGAWTLRAHGGERKSKTVSTLCAIPTKTHMSIVELLNRGMAKYLISQNTDGLHRRSGVPGHLMSELHGNSNLEKCGKCGMEYFRDRRVRTAKEVHSHETGSTCDDPACQGDLSDTIINFGENLPEKPLELAYEHTANADLCISLGSSLTVSPANSMPKKVAKRGKLVIVNLQKTPLDSMAHLRIFAKTDDIMERVMKILAIEIPSFVLRRRVKVYSDSKHLNIQGVDTTGAPYTLFPKVKVNDLQATKKSSAVFCIEKSQLADKVAIQLCFVGHYGEPELVLAHSVNEDKTYCLEFDPMAATRKWNVLKNPEIIDKAPSSVSL